MGKTLRSINRQVKKKKGTKLVVGGSISVKWKHRMLHIQKYPPREKDL